MIHTVIQKILNNGKVEYMKHSIVENTMKWKSINLNLSPNFVLNMLSDLE